MLRHGGGVIPRRPDQLAATQQFERSLDRTFREARLIGKHSQARRDRAPSGSRSAPVEKQVDEIGRRLAIVPDNVAHQDVEDVIVDRNCFPKPRHDKN